jgi:ABC-type bacteriocin/lantibiotic exporter with double-glycine peptidase domain
MTTLETLTGSDSAYEKQAKAMARSLMTSHMIVVRNGSFGWTPGDEPTLPAMNFRIQPGTINMVVGPVASGKTTLLMALLGELPVSDGFIGLSTWDIAYCAQSPWIPNGTVQQGIVGIYQFKPTWYRTVVTACGLDPDIASWPLGDHTQVGSKGVTLSGGQRQRLDLARAVYSQKELLFLDDVMSGLDNDTEKTVFDRVFGPRGLLREQGRTVVWTSSNGLFPLSLFVLI